MMTEKGFSSPTLMEREGPQQTERRHDEDDGETIVRGEDHLISPDTEILHEEIVKFLTDEAKELAV